MPQVSTPFIFRMKGYISLAATPLSQILQYANLELVVRLSTPPPLERPLNNKVVLTDVVRAVAVAFRVPL